MSNPGDIKHSVSATVNVAHDPSSIPPPRRTMSALGTHMGDHSGAAKGTIVNDAGQSRRRYKLRRSILQSIFFPHYSHKDSHAADEQRRAETLKAQGKSHDEIKKEVQPTLRSRFVDLIHTKSVQTFLLLMLVLDVVLVISEVIILSHKEAVVEVFESHHVDPHTNHTTICGPENFTYYPTVTFTHGEHGHETTHTHHNGLVVDPGCYFTVFLELPHKLHVAETVLRWISFGILVLFAIELIGLFICLLKDFFTAMYLLDTVIITVSIVLHFVLAEEEGSPAALIIFVRCWRFARILHGVGLTVHDSDEQKMEECHEKEEEAMHKVEEKNEEIEHLKEEIDKLSPQTKEGENEPFKE